jgi:membrane protein implicated in regulation of membrane protease activity
MRRVVNTLSEKDIWVVLKRIILANLVFMGGFFILNIFIDFEELHKSLPFSEVLEYQTALIIVLAALEALILVVTIRRWFRSRRLSIASVERLLQEGENEDVEFKASVRWDYKERRVNKELEYAVAKSIAGFMNAKGGTLLIGVTDEKTPIGLDMDYSTLNKRSSDGFILHLIQISNNHLGKEYSAFLSANIIRFRGKDICRIDVLPSNKPVYVIHDGQEQFFLRALASTQPMQIKEAHEYIKMHWKV